MRAHQNRNMNYDEMYEYEMFNGAAQLARGIVPSLCKHNVLFNGSYERNVSVQTSSHLILASHRFLPLLEGSQLAQHASPDEAHGAIYFVSGSLCHHRCWILAKLRCK